MSVETNKPLMVYGKPWVRAAFGHWYFGAFCLQDNGLGGDDRWRIDYQGQRISQGKDKEECVDHALEWFQVGYEALNEAVTVIQ